MQVSYMLLDYVHFQDRPNTYKINEMLRIIQENKKILMIFQEIANIFKNYKNNFNEI